MASRWTRTTLGEVAHLKGGTAFKTRFQGRTSGRYPFIKVSDMNAPPNRIYINAAANWLDEELRLALKGRLHPAGSVVFAKIGVALTYNRRRLLVRDTIIDNNMMAAVPNRDVVDSRFLYYALCAEDFNVYAQGTALPYLNAGTLKQVQLVLPPLPEQRRIAAVLGALDDKIELNRKMNRMLEEMAQAIFKSWFIDFDGHDDLMDSELGPIPRGWEVGTLQDHLTLQRGFDLPKRKRHPGLYPVFAAGGVHGSHNEYKAEAPGVVTGRSGKLGDVYLAEKPFWPLNTTLWVKKYGCSRPYHAYQLLRTLDLARFNAGSAVPSLNRNHVHNLPMPLPPPAAVERYEDTVRPLFRRRGAKREESKTLSALRDTLLPKLISGELRVPEDRSGSDPSMAG